MFVFIVYHTSASLPLCAPVTRACLNLCAIQIFLGRDSSRHSDRLIPACHVPLCQWRCWNCFGKEGIQIFCPSLRLSFPTDRLRESRPTESVGSWLPERGRSSLEFFIPRSTRDLFPVPAAVSLDTALQLTAHSRVILFRRGSGPLATVDILFLASCF